MPSGAATIRYEGKRGTVWRIKYLDADGVQQMETLGSERDGWTQKKAKAELRERLVRVERKGYRRPKQLLFRDYAAKWFEEGPAKRGWRPNTIAGYKSVKHRLVEDFGHLTMTAIRPRHVSAFIAERSKEYGASIVGRDVSVLSAIFETALREEVAESNPARNAQRPPRPRRKWRILKPPEVVAVASAFKELAGEAEGVERQWLEEHRVLFLTVIVTGIRRYEALDLRWRSVDLISNTLRVERSKSEAGERSISIPSRLAEELWQHRRRTNFQGDAERVFPHPQRGTRMDHERFSAAFRKALAKAGITDYMRPFHDARHSSLTLGAATGESSIVLMTRAGHTNMATTRQYLHLAGTAFPEDAQRLENRLLGEPETSTESSTGLDVSERR